VLQASIEKGGQMAEGELGAVKANTSATHRRRPFANRAALATQQSFSGSGSLSTSEWSERNAMPIAVRAASKSRPAPGRRPIATCVIPFAGILAPRANFAARG
jgi:hypothetical protein